MTELKEKRTDPTLQQWTELLADRIALSETFTVFLDGIDECDSTEQSALLKQFSSLMASIHQVNVLISSRESLHKDKERLFNNCHFVTTNCSEAKIDIAVYVEGMIRERHNDGDLQLGDLSLLEEIKHKMVQHADGMYVKT